MDAVAEEIVVTFNCRLLILDKYTLKPCTLFLTNERVIALVLEGISPWLITLPIIALGISFAGLLLKNFVLFFLGFFAGAVSGIAFVLGESLIKHWRVNDAKRLAPGQILDLSKRNSEILYSTIVSVKIKELETMRRSLLLPRMHAHNYGVEIVTEDKRCVFILGGGVFDRFIEEINLHVPKVLDTDTRVNLQRRDFSTSCSTRFVSARASRMEPREWA